MQSEDFRRLALALPEVVEKSHFGRADFRVGNKIFAALPVPARGVVKLRPEQRDVMVRAVVDCGAMFEVHLTLAARDDLKLAPGSEVWLVIKTYSCHVMRRGSVN